MMSATFLAVNDLLSKRRRMRVQQLDQAGRLVIVLLVAGEQVAEGQLVLTELGGVLDRRAHQRPPES